MGACGSSSKGVAADGLDDRRRSIELPRLPVKDAIDNSSPKPKPAAAKKQKMSPSKLYEVSPKTRKLYRLEDLQQQASGGVALGPAAEVRRSSAEHLIATKALRCHSYGLGSHCR